MAQPMFSVEPAFAGVLPHAHENLPVVPSIKQRSLQALARKCERCGAPGATRQDCRTQYADPKENVDSWLCAECAEEHHDYWDGMWAEYYSSSGVVSVSKQELTDLRKREKVAAMKPT